MTGLFGFVSDVLILQVLLTTLRVNGNLTTGQEADRVFKIFDEDQSRTMSADELLKLFSQPSLTNLTTKEANDLILMYNKNNGEGLDQWEFRPLFNEKITSVEHQTVFSLFDNDSDGYIGREEIRNFLRQKGMENLTKQDIDNVMNLADKNADGKVDILEIKFMFL